MYSELLIISLPAKATHRKSQVYLLCTPRIGFKPSSGQVQLHIWPVLEAGPHKRTEH